ncbi:TPA: hypothetical protein ACGW44_005336 [Bacillus toyonensis]
MEHMEYEMAHKMNDLYDLEQLIYKFQGLENKILRMKYMAGMTIISYCHRIKLQCGLY